MLVILLATIYLKSAVLIIRHSTESSPLDPTFHHLIVITRILKRPVPLFPVGDVVAIPSFDHNAASMRMIHNPFPSLQGLRTPTS